MPERRAWRVAWSHPDVRFARASADAYQCPSLQMGHNDLGDFHSESGDFQAALKCYVRTRDYCTTTKHTVSMCLNVIRVSIHMGAPDLCCPTMHPTWLRSEPPGRDVCTACLPAPLVLSCTCALARCPCCPCHLVCTAAPLSNWPLLVRSELHARCQLCDQGRIYARR